MKSFLHFLIYVGYILLWSIPATELLAQTTWFAPIDDPLLPVHGRHWNTEIGKHYQRLPNRAQKSISKAVWNLSLHTAGLYIQFNTNAPSIQVHYQVTGPLSMSHMPATGVSGIDLYTMDCNGKQSYCSAHYQFGDTIRYHYNNLSYNNTHHKGNEFTLYLPLYNGVKNLKIGVPEGSHFEFIQPSSEKPIVIYGTSIAQGGCASRPGMAWSNILQRKLDMPVINWGFSGNGYLEESFFQLMAETDAAVFIIDCMPNMIKERVGQIKERLEKGIQIIRKKSQAPILLVEHDGYMGFHASETQEKEFKAANEQLHMCYEYLKKTTKDLHYLTFEELGLNMDSQVDGIHATDWGMVQYADAYHHKLTDILFSISPSTLFTPCRQHRDANSYHWKNRHEEILKYNTRIKPQIIVMGNSITHYWGGYPLSKKQTADDVWQTLFKGKRTVNLGFGWDRIENIQWRILHGEMDGYQAESIWIMMGTNNLDLNTDDEILQGIKETIRMITKRQPKAHLYVVKILPRRNYEERLRTLNARMEQLLTGMERIDLIDMSDILTHKDGTIKEELFSDGLHPNHLGYELIAQKLKPHIDKKD